MGTLISKMVTRLLGYGVSFRNRWPVTLQDLHQEILATDAVLEK